MPPTMTSSEAEWRAVGAGEAASGEVGAVDAWPGWRDAGSGSLTAAG